MGLRTAQRTWLSFAASQRIAPRSIHLSKICLESGGSLRNGSDSDLLATWEYEACNEATPGISRDDNVPRKEVELIGKLEV